jgi:cardiolipin synthase
LVVSPAIPSVCNGAGPGRRSSIGPRTFWTLLPGAAGSVLDGGAPGCDKGGASPDTPTKGETDPQDPRADMLTSLPNILTLYRIGIIPVLLVLLYLDTGWSRWAALGLYTTACVTDYFDGYLARNRGEVSALGRFLDPVADKLLVVSVILLLVAVDSLAGLALLPALVILCRELLVSGLREYLAEVRVSLPVSKLAKWKTAIQMVALGFLIVGHASPAAIPSELIGEVGIWLAALLTLVTGYDYLAHGLKHMMEP